MNFRKQDSGTEAVLADASYAIQVADSYLAAVPGGAPAVAGLRVLELGPGSSLGAAVVLACHGARVTVADRFLVQWDEDYHRPFFRALKWRLQHTAGVRDLDPIEALLEADDFTPSAVACLATPTENLARVAPRGAFDLVLSNAVLEHLGDVPAAFASLFAVTSAGGLGLHQVDFRDHRDFSRPLEYVTLGDDDFRRMFEERCGECGNRWRPRAMAEAFERAGFLVSAFEPNLWAPDDYLDDVSRRLHPELAGLSREDLQVLSGRFRVQAGRRPN